MPHELASPAQPRCANLANLANLDVNTRGRWLRHASPPVEEGQAETSDANQQTSTSLSAFSYGQENSLRVSFYSGGRLSLQFGHISRYLIHPSRHPVWKMCRQGVTMYCRLCKIIPVPPMPVTLASSAPAAITGTSMSLAQMLQSNTFLPLDLDSPDALLESPSAADDDDEASIAKGESGDVDTLSGRAAPSSSSRKMG